MSSHTLPAYLPQISSGTHLELDRIWMSLQSHATDPRPKLNDWSQLGLKPCPLNEEFPRQHTNHLARSGYKQCRSLIRAQPQQTGDENKVPTPLHPTPFYINMNIRRELENSNIEMQSYRHMLFSHHTMSHNPSVIVTEAQLEITRKSLMKNRKLKLN